VQANPDANMADLTAAPASPRDWRAPLLTGIVCFPACFALFYFVLPAAGWFAEASASTAAFVCAALLSIPAVLVAGAAGAWRLHGHNRRMRIALDNMSQGLCMFDGRERLVICNRRYLDMYNLPAAAARTGTTLTRLLDYRVANGTFLRDVGEYRRDLLASMEQGRTTTNEVKSPGGRVTVVINRPMPNGGWVATHEDITERRQAEHERALLQEQQQRRGTVEQAIAAFRQRVEEHLNTVRDCAMTMRATATTLFANSGQTSQSAESAVAASNEASVNVETASTAADELTGSIGEIGRQLSMTTDIVRTAVREARDTNAQISSLAQAAQKIGDVIKLIRTIAGQTNLLALNATIEAARAGEAGKGFSVVASEVKSLAVQTAKATEDIAQLIASVQGATTSAVAAIGRIAGRMREIDSCATAVSSAVEEQSAATGEISQNVASAAQGAKMVVSVLSEVVGAATDTRGSAESVLSASQAVESAAAELRREVEGFLAGVAA
jgi:methyl-accepting chemotaxis protein